MKKSLSAPCLRNARHQSQVITKSASLDVINTLNYAPIVHVVMCVQNNGTKEDLAACIASPPDLIDEDNIKINPNDDDRHLRVLRYIRKRKMRDSNKFSK